MNPPTAHRPLRLLNLYRVVAAGSLFVLVLGGEQGRSLGASSPDLFLWTAGLYLVFGLFSAVTLLLRRPAPLIQLYGQLLVDILAITLLAYASGGARSGLGGLLFVPVAVGSIMAPQRSAVLFAAIATLAMLGAEVYAQLAGLIAIGGYTQAGILGLILFTTSVVGHLLASQARESEALAEQRGVDLANLAQLNEYVIQHLQTGVIVVDDDERIRMHNASAAALLGAGDSIRGKALRSVSPMLSQCMRDWRNRPWDEPPTLPGAASGTVIIPHLTRLGAGTESGGTLVFLEDSRVVGERMQSMKLAALGRLTASIAHEIRNPLGALSHAGQLLEESSQAGPEEHRLTEIIRTQTARVNTIIENVLQLSRREQTRPENLDLGSWLKAFGDEFRDTHDLPASELKVQVPDALTVRMDPSHLQQVLWNLCENALRHGRAGGLELVTRVAGTGAVSLEVLDRGPGIDPGIVQHIFEPFYSASAQGTGLGLFIARELCECNQARLSYHPRNDGGSCFRISFAEANRWVI